MTKRYRITAPRKRTRRGRQSSSRRRYRSPAPSRFRLKVPLSLKQHQFCERAEGGILTIGNEAGTYAAPFYTKTFKFRDIGQCLSYSTIFEQYRLDKVVATFRYKGIAAPALQSAGGGAGTGFVNELNPMLYFKVDHNDINVNTLAQMKLSTKCRTHMFTNNSPEFSISLKPAAQVLTLSGATGGALTTTNTPEWKKWLDADGPTGPGTDCDHYGLKIYALGYKDANFDPGTIDIEYKYYFSCKSNE
jgi:hypothetical protein